MDFCSVQHFYLCQVQHLQHPAEGRPAGDDGGQGKGRWFTTAIYPSSYNLGMIKLINFPFWGNQTMQMYGKFAGFLLKYCIVWVGNIMTPVIMEVENGCNWKVTTIGGTHFSLNHDCGRKGRGSIDLEPKPLFCWPLFCLETFVLRCETASKQRTKMVTGI